MQKAGFVLLAVPESSSAESDTPAGGTDRQARTRPQAQACTLTLNTQQKGKRGGRETERDRGGAQGSEYSLFCVLCSGIVHVRQPITASSSAWPGGLPEEARSFETGLSMLPDEILLPDSPSAGMLVPEVSLEFHELKPDLVLIG